MIGVDHRPTLAATSPVSRPEGFPAIPNRLKFLGGAAVESTTGRMAGRATQRARIGLLALLASGSRPARSRDQLVGFLWPDADPERGRKLLSDSIYRVNQALGGDAITGSGEDVSRNADQLGSDVADFEAAVQARDWRQAVELYAGPFLDGFFLPDAAEFDQWMEAERARLARSVAKAIEALAVEARDAGRTTEAVDWWQRLAAHVPDDSRVAMELMRALDASGNRAGAIRHARVHAVLLKETLGVEPDAGVQELAGRLSRGGEGEPARERPSAVKSPFSSAPALPSGAERTSTPPLEPEPASPRRAPWLFGSVLAVLAIAIVLWSPWQPSGASGPTTPALGNAIAVLPFTSVSEGDSSTYFADGMSEELMYLLTRVPGLHVASPTSSFAYRDLDLDVREVARRLRVDWILEGSVRRAGDRLRIVAQLTDARNGYQLWSESFDRSEDDIFAIQQEIAVAIARRLQTAIGESVGAAPEPELSGPTDPAVYDLYLQARFQWHRRTEESLRRSAALFEQVVAREPGYARAWAGLGDAYAVMAFYDYARPHEAYPKADTAARRAIALDSTLAMPYATLAYVNTYYHWDWEAAELGFRRAIELEPSNSVAHQWYSNLLTATGRFDEAVREMRRAAVLDPLSMIAHAATGWVFLLADRNDDAIRQLQGTLQLDSTFQLAHYWMGVAREQRGQPAEAIPYLQHAVELSDGSTLMRAGLAHALASAGRTDSARAILDDLLRLEASGAYVSSYEVGKLYLALGDVPAALTRLERAYADRAHSIAFLQVDPQLRGLAGEPRFRALVARVGAQ